MTRSRIDPEIWPEMAVFAERVVTFRKMRGLKQAELSQKTGLDQSFISAVENMQTNPSAQVQIALARALEVPVAALWPDTVLVTPKE